MLDVYDSSLLFGWFPCEIVSRCCRLPVWPRCSLARIISLTTSKGTYCGHPDITTVLPFSGPWRHWPSQRESHNTPLLPIIAHDMNILWQKPGSIFCLLLGVWSKLRLCSANHRAGYFSNLACDWLSIVWAYSGQETENGPSSCKAINRKSLQNSLTPMDMGFIWFFAVSLKQVETYYDTFYISDSDGKAKPNIKQRCDNWPK